MLKKAHEPTLP